MATRARRVSLFVLPILLAALLTSAPAPAIGTCVTPPDIVPLQDLTPGTTGTAWTVVEGTTPVSFDVEVLDTLPDALLPGKALVVIQVSGPVIDATGGIASGMSGSPVYVGGKLAGAISYGFGEGADHTIGGMTPAQDMIDIISYPDPLTPLTVHLSEAQRRAVAREAGLSLARTPGSLDPIQTPVAVSGLSNRRLALLQRQLDTKSPGLQLFKAGSAAAPQPTLPPPPLAPGESMAAVVSYGDLTFAGIGTATAVCGDQVLGWGHPYFFSGNTTMGMAAANIITVVTDPSGVWGPFKMGTVTDTHGAIDQDRLSAIRGVEGGPVSLVPITSHVDNVDLARDRDGQTDVALPEAVPYIGAFHLLQNLDSVNDAVAAGTVRLDWHVEGTDPDAQPFQLDYGDSYYSSYDVTGDSIWEFYDQLERIRAVRGTAFTSIHVDAELTGAELRSEIVDVWAATPTRPKLKPRATIKARPGDKLGLRVFLQPAAGPVTSVDLTYKIPRWARGDGPLMVSGGAEESYGYYYAYDSGAPARRATLTLDEVLTDIRTQVRNSDVVVSLFPTRRDALHEKRYGQDALISGEFAMWLVLAR